MTEQKNLQDGNPLATQKISTLLIKFAIPSIIAMLVTGLYNIVDQIFIGNFVGELGNAATNISFPLSTLCTATSLMFGIGGAAAFNLAMGAGKKDEAGKYVGNAVITVVFIALVLTIVSEVFLEPMLVFFGASKRVLPYARDYTRITAFGFPFLILTVTSGQLIRADGKPLVAMICNLTGAFLNTGLDALFVIGFGWGMKGAAAATVIGQIFGAGIAGYHILHFRTVKLTKSDWAPDLKVVGRVAYLGMSQGLNQIAMMAIQIVLNNSLRYYGSLSIYGEDIPVAVVGISSKLAMLYFSFCIGISHALQPIASFNCGARNYQRTKEAFFKAVRAGLVISIIAFLIFQIFPKQIISLFGKGSDLYVQFAVRYIRIYMFCTFINCFQPMTSTFFSAIGKPKSGLFLSLTRQIIFLLPLIIVLPLIWGIDGMMYSGLVADALAFLVAGFFSIREFSRPEYKTR